MIYQPKGRAREYADWALNIYDGCEHGCSYCYAPQVLHKSRPDFGNADVRKDFHDRLAKSLSSWKGPTNIQVLLCFTCDPYQPIERFTFATRKTVKMLHDAGMSVCVLTKAPTLAYRDIDLYKYRKDSIATTLTFSSNQTQESLAMEPRAELPHQRIMGLKAFHEAGVDTWVSLEPIIDVDATIENILTTYKFVNYYKVGKLNYQASDISWKDAVQRIVGTLERLDCSYMLKDSLKEYM